MQPLSPTSFPVRLAAILISISLILALLYVGQDIFIPLSMALLFAILLRPLVAWMERKLRFPLMLAVSASVLLALGVLTGLISYISLQLGDIASDWANIKINLWSNYFHLQLWVDQHFGISISEQNLYLEQVTNDIMVEGKNLIGSTLNSFTGTLLNVILIPFYTFLLLLYRNLLIGFLLKVFPRVSPRKIHLILFQIKRAIQSFLVGTLIEMGIVAILTTIGLMIIGMKYAILLGLITGILNLIPYIGILVATSLTLLATLTGSAHFSVILGIVIMNAIIHLIDSNILMPLVVSSKVKMNALISILLIVIGSHLAGVAGMFLAIPLAGMLKIIFEEIDGLKPWGYLFGDVVPTIDDWAKTELPILDSKSDEEASAEEKIIKANPWLKRLSQIFR